MAGRFEGQVAFVTGAARGMGRASALAFAEEGAAVAITDLLEDELESVADELRSMNAGVVALAGDVSEPATADQLVVMAQRELGPITVLHNNAGLFTGALIEDETVESFRRLLNVNCIGYFNTIKRILPEMRETGRGAIVNTSSICGLRGMPSLGAYSASKAAVIGLTRVVAAEAAPVIRCNAVCPGAIDTPMADESLLVVPVEERDAVRASFSDHQLMKRYAQPEEIIRLVLFLASDEAGFITGQAVSADGGWTA